MPYTMLRAAALSVTFLARACGEEAETVTPVATAQIAAPTVAIAAPPVAPTRGGTMVSAGPAQLEVVSHASGEVYAYPAVGLDAPARADVTVNVAIEGGAHPVPMRWVARERRYVGRAEGVVVVPGPATVTVAVGPTRYVGVSPILVVAPAVVVGANVHVAPVPVVHVDYRHGKHKHKHRGRGHGHGHGNSGIRVRVH